MRNKFCSLLLLLIMSVTLCAQNQPKVGLVLSGGGAKGFAHIGVLKEIEKSGLQIDYIGGTSMGAIIGGLYAVGYRADQIETIIKKTDFMALLQDKISRRQKTLFNKLYLEKHAVSLPFNKGILTLPLGLSKGQNALNMLTELCSSVDEVKDFSKLPIPFFCIGTDIETGREVVLEQGSLSLAIRASASFPSLLNPVEVDERILVDGGVVNNFPVDRMKEKGVDIIIGVNVQGKLSNRNELSSIGTILNQIINFQMYSKSKEQVKMTNIYMRPKILEYGVTSFEDSKAIIKQGVLAAKQYTSVFSALAQKQRVKKPAPKLKVTTKKFYLDRIIIKGNKRYTNNYVLGKLQLKKGDSVDYHDISKKINALTATDNFERIDYQLDPSFKGKKLTLILKEDKIKTYLRLGLHYDALYKSAVLLNYNSKRVISQNDELSADIIVGDNIRYNLHYFIDNGLLPSLGFSSRYNRFQSDFLFNTSNIDKLSLKYRDFTNSLYLQTTLNKKFGLGFGLEHKMIEAKTETILNANNEESYLENSRYVNSYAFLKMDTFDKAMFPKNGFYADLGFKWFMWSNRNEKLNEFLPEAQQRFNQFSQAKGKISFAFTFKDKLTFQYISEGGYTFSGEESQVFDFRLGGYNKNYINNFIPFYGYEIADLTLTNQSFLKSEFNFRYEIFKKNYAVLIANYARVEDNVFRTENVFANTKSGYALGYSVESLIGPIELKYAWSPDHNQKFWLFNLGFWF